MSALIIGEAERARINEMRNFAAAAPIVEKDAIAAAEQDIAGFRDMMLLYSSELPIGYRVTFTHVLRPVTRDSDRIATFLHISISVDRVGKVPSPAAVELILQAFGMGKLESSGQVYIEHCGPGFDAVNVTQRAP